MARRPTEKDGGVPLYRRRKKVTRRRRMEPWELERSQVVKKRSPNNHDGGIDGTAIFLIVVFALACVPLFLLTGGPASYPDDPVQRAEIRHQEKLIEAEREASLRVAEPEPPAPAADSSR